jgi:hypothetical protein
VALGSTGAGHVGNKAGRRSPLGGFFSPGRQNPCLKMLASPAGACPILHGGWGPLSVPDPNPAPPDHAAASTRRRAERV